tara:strand:- start:2156 stop:2905 length:750 start_codon:yes stop_codon:yes gene_type:complete
MFREIRANLRKGKIEIIEDIHVRKHPYQGIANDEICVFCKTEKNITKEHIIPKWVFEKNVNDTMVSSANKRSQTYNKAVIPVCETCNNGYLSKIENHIKDILFRIDGLHGIILEDLYDLIRWIEIIDYKFQVHECRRRYIKYGDSSYDKDWGAFPIAHLRQLQPFKSLTLLKRAVARITKKSKNGKIESLVISRPTIKHFDFFYLVDEHLYLSFPMYNLSIFYFLKKEFDSIEDSFKEAYEIIDIVKKS